MDRRSNGRSNGHNGRRVAESNGRRAAASNGHHSTGSHQTPPPRSQPVPSPPSPPSPPEETTLNDAELAAQSAAYFDELFGPASRGMVRSYASSSTRNGTQPANGTTTAGSNGGVSDDGTYQMARSPWQYANSIFYGGQEDIYVRPRPRPPQRRPEDPIDDDSYSNLGDWWRGSYHY